MTLTYVIDNVCLHAAKVEEAENHYNKQIGQLLESDEDGKEAMAEQLRLQMEDEVKAIPLLAVPRSSKGRKKVEGGADAEKMTGQGQTKKAGDKADGEEHKLTEDQKGALLTDAKYVALRAAIEACPAGDFHAVAKTAMAAEHPASA